jgi:hypothetical protein
MTWIDILSLYSTKLYKKGFRLKYIYFFTLEEQNSKFLEESAK